MDKLTGASETSRLALCSSTIEYLTAHGFISSAHGSGLALRSALQGLHSGDADEQDGLTHDDDDSEQLAAQLVESRVSDPQQKILSEKPAGPTTLVEARKALIEQVPASLAVALLKETSVPLLRFDGRDALVMPRASLQEVPMLKRKSTLEPLGVRSLKTEAQEVIRTLRVSKLKDSEHPAAEIRSIDTCLKIGPTASRQLFDKSQSLLSHIQSVMSTGSPSLISESLLPAPTTKFNRPASPILMPARSSSLSTLRSTERIEKPDVQTVLCKGLTLIGSSSTHGMDQLMGNVDYGTGGSVTSAVSLLMVSSASTAVSPPLLASESFRPGGRPDSDASIESPLKSRRPPVGTVKRAHFSEDTDHDGASKGLKRQKTESPTNQSCTERICPASPYFLAKNVKVVPFHAFTPTNDTLLLSPSRKITLSKAGRSDEIEHQDPLSTATESATMEGLIQANDAKSDKLTSVASAVWVGTSPRCLTSQSIANMYEDFDQDEVDELASSVDEIEDFCEMARSMSTLDGHEARPHEAALSTRKDVTELCGNSLEQMHPADRSPESKEKMSMSGSDELVFTQPSGQSKATTPETTSTTAALTAESQVAQTAVPSAIYADRQGDGQGTNGVSACFTKGTTHKENPSAEPISSTSRVTETVIGCNRPRVSPTQLSTGSLAALVALKRGKKQQNRKITDFFGQKHAKDHSKTRKIDIKDVNGYLVLRSRTDLLRSLPLNATIQSPDLAAKSKVSANGEPTANAQGSSLEEAVTKPGPFAGLLPKSKQALLGTPPALRLPSPPESRYDLTNLDPFKCFGSFRLLQNSAIDRALDMHNVDLIYPDEHDPVSLRAINLSRTKQQSVIPQITQPDIILSPRSCLFYYRLSSIYQMTNVLDQDLNRKRMHHSRIVLNALKLFSEQYDKIILVLEGFEPLESGETSKKMDFAINPFTPAIKRALDKLHADIGTLAEKIQRPLGEEVDIEVLLATSPMQAAAFAREHLDVRFAQDIQLGQLGWDRRLFDMFGLNDLSAHHLVIEAGSLEAFQEMPESDRNRRFLNVLGSGKLDRINRMLRSQAAFGTLARTDRVVAQTSFHGQRPREDEDTATSWVQSAKDSYYEDPNYAAYNHLPDSFSQANLTQTGEDSCVGAYYMYDGDSTNINMENSKRNERMMYFDHKGQTYPAQVHYDVDDLESLILDDADIEAELDEPSQQQQELGASPSRPFTPVNQLGSFWPADNQGLHYGVEAEVGAGGHAYTVIGPLYGGIADNM